MNERKPGVTPTRIVAIATDLADTHGLERLTMAAIAREVGTSVPALYKHVASLDEVRRGIAFTGITGLTTAVSEAAIGQAGPDAVRAAAAAYRHYAHTHPGAYAASIVAPPANDAAYTELSERAVRLMIALFAAWSLDEPGAIDAVRSFRTILHGFVSLEDAGGFGLAQSVDATFARIVAGFITMLDTWADAEPSPTTASSQAW